MSKKGRGKKKSQRPTALILLVVILAATNIGMFAYFTVLNPSVPLEDVPMSIADVMGDNSSIGKMVSVLGYYVYTAGYHLLVSNPASFFNNSLSRTNHMVITGDVPESMADHAGFQISVKGILGLFEPDGDTGTIGFESFFDVETEVTVQGRYIEEKLNPLPLLLEYPGVFLMPIDPDAEKYALLYSGGINEQKAYYRYWNDIIYMKFILNMHGYSDENIYVVYKDGQPEDDANPVHYPATHDSMDTVFDLLAADMGYRDTLFFYTTNHGGSGGISVWNPMDSGGALTHTEVSDWLDLITCNNMIIVMEQCVSGKFITHLAAEDRVILTACKDDESSWPCDGEGVWDEFVYHFMCALVSFSFHDPLSVVDADYNNDGDISMKEAFIYAAINDSRDETPWYNDFFDGSTQGYHVWQAAYALPGSPGESVFL
ncbi:MAG: C13 family peptidase [Candidatus Thorarchaeota archaeon]